MSKFNKIYGNALVQGDRYYHVERVELDELTAKTLCDKAVVARARCFQCEATCPDCRKAQLEREVRA